MTKQDNIVMASTSSGNAKKPSKRRARVLILLALFLVICCAVTLCLTTVLQQKWDYVSNNAAEQIVRGYYLEPEHSIDVLCLGASAVRNGISGLEMYKEYGFTTYSRATSVQLPLVSYYLLQETLENQDIKAVVMDSSILWNTIMMSSTENLIGKLHEAIDRMPLSKHKLDIIASVKELLPSVSYIDFLFPLYTYHDRWTEITEEDFEAEDKIPYCYKGQYPSLKMKAYSYEQNYMSEDAESYGDYYLVDSLVEYAKMAIDLCKEHGIEFVLLKMPAGGWNVHKHNIMESFAQENGVTFIDFNDLELQNLIGFDPKTDFADTGKHPNITGAKKISSYLGEYLCSVCDFEDKRGNPDYASWDSDYEQYKNLLKDAEVSREKNLITFLKDLKNPNYLAFVSTYSDSSAHYNDSVAEAFQDLGINVDFANTPFLSYIGIIDGGELVYEKMDEDPSDEDSLVTDAFEYAGHIVEMASNANPLTDNESTIIFDGDSYKNATKGFNFLVYDKSVKQIVIYKGFYVGIGGTEYSPDSPFKDYTGDPLEYLAQLSNEDYIAVLGVSAEGSRYMPGVVNDKLVEMGLIPLDKEFNRPYIAVLDGGEIVYNAYGEPGTELSASCNLAGFDVDAVSSAKSGDAHLYVSIGGEVVNWTRKQTGLSVGVFSKSEGQFVSIDRFDWSNNYLAVVKVNATTNALELLGLAQRSGYDMLCVYAAGNPAETLPETVVQALGKAGMDVEEGSSYVGILYADGRVEQQSGSEVALLEADIDGMRVALSASGEASGATFGGVEYNATVGELSLYLYDRQSRAVLTQARYATETSDVIKALKAAVDDPLEYLAQLSNEDYIAVLEVSAEGSRYMPGVVNDKLVEMGLIPLDKEFNRPYIAVLDGGEIVYNAYGEPGTELSASCNLAGFDVDAVSSAKSGDAHLYVSIGGEVVNWTRKQTGLSVGVFSKSEGQFVSIDRFDWSKNYLAAVKVNATTNALELLGLAQRSGYDMLCVYAAGNPAETLPETVVQALGKAGMDVEEGSSYVGILYADGRVEQQSGSEVALLEADIDGMRVALSASGEASGATFGGVEYNATVGELSLYLYDRQSRAVLTQARYATETSDVIKR